MKNTSNKLSYAYLANAIVFLLAFIQTLNETSLFLKLFNLFASAFNFLGYRKYFNNKWFSIISNFLNAIAAFYTYNAMLARPTKYIHWLWMGVAFMYLVISMYQILKSPTKEIEQKQ